MRASPRRQNLIWRVLTGIAFVPALVYMIHQGGWVFSTFIFATVVVGAWEWWRLGRPTAGWVDLVLVTVGALGLLQGAQDARPDRLIPFLAVFFLVMTLLLMRHSDGRAQARAGHILVGMLYVGLLPAFLLRMRALPDGCAAILLTYAVVFACDSAAYGCGRTFGRLPLWPRISPKKTWEGAIGGLVGAVIVAVLGALWFARFLSIPEAIGFGLIVGIIGQCGDLVESLWKREAGIKDSSQVIPGHGGVLDRFDNLHFAAPILFLYLLLCA